MTTQTIQLQSVGHVPAIQASEVREGDVKMYNFGSCSTIIKIIEKTEKTLTFIEFTHDSKQYYMYDVRKTSLTAIVKRDQDVSEHKPTEASCRRKGMVNVSEYFQTETEEQKLEKYHLELQEKGMAFAATKPEIKEESTYKVVVCVDRDTNEVGEFTKVLTGKELDFQLFMNEVLEIIEEIKETPVQNEVIETNEKVLETPVNEITYQTGTGTKGNGIEITFTEKPSEDVRNAMKANGYRWAGKQRSNVWWAIMNDKTVSLAKQLAWEQETNESNEPVETPAYEYPEINIDDCTDEKYNISQSLQDREHDANWIFRQNKKDHNKELQELFAAYTNKVKKIIETLDNNYYIYKIKSALQSFKKNYHSAYINWLSAKTSQPHWAVSGRGNLNKSKYEKALNRQDKWMIELVNLPKELESRIEYYQNKIYRDKEAELKAQLQKELSEPLPELKFKTVTKEVERYGKLRFYEYEGYSIGKVWGAFRVYFNGKEIYSTKSAGTLQDAKAYVSLQIKKDRGMVS